MTLATIEDPAVIERILTHLGLSMEAAEALRARASPWTDTFRCSASSPRSFSSVFVVLPCV